VHAGRIFQCIWPDAGGMLAVMSEPSSDVRQAATPKKAVRLKVATSKIIQKNWFTPCPPQPALNVEERARSTESENAAGLTYLEFYPGGELQVMGLLKRIWRPGIAESLEIRAAGTRRCVRSSSPGLTGRPSIPETAAMEPMRRGVLDTRCAGMTAGCAERDSPMCACTS
jgi:hypothetical protein